MVPSEKLMIKKAPFIALKFFSKSEINVDLPAPTSPLEKIAELHALQKPIKYNFKSF
jgi:hypothetical protein